MWGMERGSETETSIETSRNEQSDVWEKVVEGSKSDNIGYITEKLDARKEDTSCSIAEGTMEKVARHDPITHYCITRADIPHGLQAAQLIHAAGESSPGNLPPHTYAIALVAKNEADLNDISFQLFKAGIKHKRIVESDEPWNNQLMAIGIPPMPRSKLKKLLSKYPLLR
jgi:hypothetical protein